MRENLGAAPFVPLLIGRGKLAKHLVFAFQSAERPLVHVPDAKNLKNDPSLLLKLAVSSHAWILTNDDSIPEIADLLRTLKSDVKIIHSAGAVEIPGTTTLHPLMTFTDTLYAREQYFNLPWVSFSNEPQVEIPFFKNRIILNPEERTRYHAACVMISNFSNILWSSGVNLIPSLTRDHFLPILTQTLINFMNEGSAALTGPLKRNDQSTVDAHLSALHLLPEEKLYQSFTNYYGEKNPS